MFVFFFETVPHYLSSAWNKGVSRLQDNKFKWDFLIKNYFSFNEIFIVKFVAIRGLIDEKSQLISAWYTEYVTGQY